ncbi:MAG: bifunctional 4-hydroxy-2-oxoglutarate aldolase/2-dehydro-3-deoxy-phosphogluconate aldolase [Christensenellales bacterium]
MSILDTLRAKRAIAIVRGIPKKYAVPLAEAFLRGGICMTEFTFDQRDSATWRETAEAISAIAEAFEGKISVGAGTVLTSEQLHIAKDAGAQYIVAPNVNPALIEEAKALSLGAFPGALTPSEIVTAYAAGADAVKLFPAANLGTGYVKAVCAPLAHIPLIAVGGINEKNAADYIAAGCIGVGVGGNLVDKEKIARGEWDDIARAAKALADALGI